MTRSIALLLCVAWAAVAGIVTESDWQVAFNSRVTNGKLEQPTKGGRVDIVTEDHAIEVDRVRKYREGIGQCFRYAQATGKSAGLALYFDGPGDTYEAFEAAKAACDSAGIRLWLINEYVSVDDLIRQKGVTAPGPAAGTAAVAPAQKTRAIPAPKVECNYWVNTSSGVRHNASCRWFKNTKAGRCCGKSEGRACGTCGG
jgi:hypothetical protein